MDNSLLAFKLTAEIPKVRWFLSLKNAELARITGTDEARWTRYFQGVFLGEKALNRFAKALNMQPSSVLLAVNLRREGQKLSQREKVGNLV